VQRLSVQDDVLVANIHLSVNQMNETIEQVTAKMQRSHLELLKLQIDDLIYAGAPERALSKLFSLRVRQEKKDPEWFNSASNYGEATSQALECQQDVLNVLCEPPTWDLSDAAYFTIDVGPDDRWQITTEMRSVAVVASRLGEKGIDSAIKLLQMSLDPRHLLEADAPDPERLSDMRRESLLSVVSPRTTSGSGAGSAEPPVGRRRRAHVQSAGWT